MTNTREFNNLAELNDNELQSVEGGIIMFIAGFAAGCVAGYIIAKYID